MPAVKVSIRCLDGLYERDINSFRNAEFGLDENAGNMPAILLSSWTSLLSDSPVDNLKPYRIATQLIREATTIGLLKVIDKYSRLYDSLVENIKVVDGELTFPFLHEFKDTPIFREYLHWTRTKSTSTFIFISTFLRFGKKCEFNLDEFDTRALRSWVEVEDRISSHVYDEDLTRDLRHVLHSLLPDVPPTYSFVGKHGSGAVSGPERGAIAKCSAFRLNSKLRLLLSTASPFRCFSYLLENAGESEAAANAARLMFVPKNYKTSRSICMEPLEMMYMQQHVRHLLEDAISASIIGSYVQIDNQARNQAGALYGSRSTLVDTIDLSAASDSVTTRLVTSVFPRDWLIGLLGTRTSQVILPDGSIRDVAKFAPMGSALCFPVQSLLYFGVVYLCYLQHYYRSTPIHMLSKEEIRSFDRFISKDWQSNALYESVAVYGDDIICDTRITEDVIATLEALGFVVNSDKSFIGPQAFRESCGVFALFGEDVTPFHFKAKEVKKRFDARSLPSLVALANSAGDYKYSNLHSQLINLLLRWGSKRYLNPILFGTRFVKEELFSDSLPSTIVFSKNPRNTHLKMRNNEALQREEYRSWIVSYRTKTGQRDVDHDLYDRYLLDLYYRKGQNSREIDTENSTVFVHKDGTFYSSTRDEFRGTKMRRAWTPTY